MVSNHVFSSKKQNGLNFRVAKPKFHYSLYRKEFCILPIYTLIGAILNKGKQFLQKEKNKSTVILLRIFHFM